MESSKSAFTPWRNDFKESIVLCAGGGALAGAGGVTLFLHMKDIDSTRASLIVGLTLGVAGIAICKLGVGAFKRGYFRRHGARVEQAVIDRLAANLPDGWRLARNAQSAAGGDVDVIINTGKSVYAVEIKSATSTWGCHSYFRRLLGIGIDRRADQAIEQARRNALAVSPSVIPIVWLPLAKRFQGMRRDVMVVGGDVKYFINAIS
jgi:Holliday junction resolvase-like predicted endonuclease